MNLGMDSQTNPSDLSFLPANSSASSLSPDTASLLGITGNTNQSMDVGAAGGGAAPSWLSGLGTGVLDYIKNNPGIVGLGGLSAYNAMKGPSPLPGAGQQLQTNANTTGAFGNNILNTNGQITPTQKGGIDASINQQEQDTQGMLKQNAINSGMGADSLVTKQQLQKMTQSLEGQRQQEYMAQQTQNINQALSALGISNSGLNSVAQMQLGQDQQAQQLAGSFAGLAAKLAALSGGGQPGQNGVTGAVKDAQQLKQLYDKISGITNDPRWWAGTFNNVDGVAGVNTLGTADAGSVADFMGPGWGDTAADTAASFTTGSAGGAATGAEAGAVAGSEAGAASGGASAGLGAWALPAAAVAFGVTDWNAGGLNSQQKVSQTLNNLGPKTFQNYLQQSVDFYSPQNYQTFEKAIPKFVSESIDSPYAGAGQTPSGIVDAMLLEMQAPTASVGNMYLGNGKYQKELGQVFGKDYVNNLSNQFAQNGKDLRAYLTDKVAQYLKVNPLSNDPRFNPQDNPGWYS